MDIRGLPSGWIRVRSGECIKWSSGGTPLSGRSEYYNGTIPWAIIGDLNDGPVVQTERSISEFGLANSAAKWVEENSILIALYGSIGKLGIAKVRLTTNQAIAFAKTYPLETLYVFYYLLGERDNLKRLGRGGTQLNINLRILNDYPIVIAPLVEQRAIAAKIEELFSELDKGVEQLQTVKQQLKQYRQAVLKAAFEGKLTVEWRAKQQAAGNLPDAAQFLIQITKEREGQYQQQLLEWKKAVAEWKAAGDKDSGMEKPGRPASLDNFQPLAESDLLGLHTLPNSWQWVYLGMFSEIMGGVAKGRKVVGRTVVNLPYLRVANVQNGYLDLTEVKEMAIPIEEKPKYLLKAGDVLYTEGGDRDKLGRGTVWRGELGTCIHQNHVFRARPVASIDSDYLAYFSQTKAARTYFMKHGKQTVNLASINMTLLSHLPVPIPSVEEQRCIVEGIASRLSILDELDKAVVQGLKQAEALRKSILKKAFEGRLLGNGELASVRSSPEYEPVDMLLERIRAQGEPDNQASGRTPKGTQRKTLSRPRSAKRR